MEMSDSTPPGTEQPADLWLVERLLSEDPAGTTGDPELTALVTALRAPATADELAAHEGIRAAFVRTQTLRRTRTQPRRRPVLPTLLATKAAAAAALAVAALGGTAAAAVGALPAGLQDVAHRAIGAPATGAGGDQPATPGARHTATPAARTPGRPRPRAVPTPAPAPPWPVAFTHGGLATPSTAYSALVRAAGGADRITAYCAAVQHPGTTPTTKGSPATPPTGPPATPPHRSAGDPRPGAADRSRHRKRPCRPAHPPLIPAWA